MKQSVAGIFTYENEIYVIKRQNYLRVFPGYHSFPGGKIDNKDRDTQLPEHNFFQGHQKHLLVGLFRELKEELDQDVLELINASKVKSIRCIGKAVTPDFNPYRFENFYFVIDLNEKIDICAKSEEAEKGYWCQSKELLAEYEKAKVLAVPPMVKILKTLGEDISFSGEIDFELPYDKSTEVPMIESVCGVKQFLPLSNTFPPANRTNCFLIGEVLIDPSPKDESEFKKLLKSVEKFSIKKIFLSHHHPDHYEFSNNLALNFNVPMAMSSYTMKLIEEKSGKDYFEGIKVEILKEGDVLTQSLEKDIVVYEVPGHDEGQLALAPKNLTWFFVGDLIQSVGTVVIGAPEGDMRKYFSSLKRVIDLSPMFIYPSHGIALGGVHKLEETLKHRLEREDQVKNCLNKGMSELEMLEVIYPGLDKRLEKYALKTIAAHLKKINEDA